jgi:hypothetical protein
MALKKVVFTWLLRKRSPMGIEGESPSNLHGEWVYPKEPSEKDN